MSILSRLNPFKAVEEKKAPERKPKDQPANPGAGMANTIRPLGDYQTYIEAVAALKHPMTFRCISKIASSVATVEWYAEADPEVPASERAGATAIKAMNALLKSPNDNMSANQLRYWMALNYATHNRIPCKVGIGSLGDPNGIYPLAVRHTSAVQDNRGNITKYTYGFGENAETIPVRKKAINGRPYAFEIATPNLDGTNDMTCNVTALRAIGLPAAIMNMLMQRAIDTASGHPNNKYIIASEKTITDKQKEAMGTHLEEAASGGDESGNVLFLHNTKVDVHKLDNDLSDIHSKLPSDDMARMIAGAFGVPIALIGLGAADGAKFAGNYIESRTSFWEDTIIPCYLSPIATGLTSYLCEAGMRIRFDIDSVPALSYSRAAKSKDLTLIDFLTDDEKRELAGYSPMTAAQKAEITAARDAKKPVPAQPATAPNNGNNNDA